MANTIRIGIFEVSSFKVGLKDPKIYLGDVLLYPLGGYKVCYAVVEDISQYQETEFEDVYDKATEKWYKLNNLNQYEQYGVYGSGKNITYYDGKLTIDDGYEYQYSGDSWINVGEVSGSSRVPIGYTEVEYIQNTGTSYLNIAFTPNQDTRVVMQYQMVTDAGAGRFWGAGAWNSATGIQPNYEGGYLQMSWLGKTSWTRYNNFPADYNKHLLDLNKNYLYLDETLVGSNTYTTRTASDPIGVFTYIGSGRPSQSGYWGQEHFKGKMYSFKVYDNGTLVRDLVPCKRGNDNTVGAYDIVNDVFYTVPTGYTTDKLVAGAETGNTEYPVYYSEKSDPLDNLTFNTIAEAQAYAEANCVYDGMKATIGTDRYYFDSEDENGWVKVTEYYIVEDVTPNQASGWTISGSSTYNPDSSYYDDFDLETTSTSNVTKIAKVTIYGYDHFTYYLRTSGYSTYNYVAATNVDEIQTPPASMSYDSSSAITNTYNWNKSPKSAVNLSNYRRVTYNNLDKTVEHTFYVYFYGRTYSSYVGNATILIPKEQTNENWEQVTFSASSNVASSSGKNLYIDGNYSSSGGTQYWYYRWMIGLPSGSHTSYTNYSNYNYCPNVTSSTFTSVAGEQRQVNFTYDNTTNKSLQFRLVDTSGNTLSPSNTVYYNMTYYNSCSVSSSSSNVTFPRSQSVKVGGRFRFANSSNRHYIYGYSPNISLNYDYYVDNYQSTFDITYTKLSEEAVTITYTTYDPSDVETPSFKTDITWPYNGGTKITTATTSYDVPYTYNYTVEQTSNMFYAASQTFTASQASRTVTFTLYPNNREFATVADMEAYQYVWEGMKAIVGDTKYQYKNGVWTESTYTELEYIQCGSGTTSTNGGLQLLTNVTADYYFEVESQCVIRSTSPMIIGEKSDVEVVSYQLGLCYYSSMFFDYGGGRLSTSINSTTQNERHTYGAGHISGSSNQNVVGVKLDGVVKNTTNVTTRVEGLPYLVGGTVTYSGHSASDVKVNNSQTDVIKLYSIKIYKDYGDTLVGDYIPVINSDNVVTLYDKVSGNYATPYGTLIAGPEKT